MNKIAVVVYCTLLSLNSYGQKLGVGDYIPRDIVEKYSVLNQTKFGLTILDFWSHSCASCIESFEKLNHIKSEIGDKVNIVLVNSETVDSTNIFFEKRLWIERPKNYLISGDEELKNLFNFRGVPFIVWLDKDFKILKTTTGRHLTLENIESYLINGELNMEEYSPVEYVQSIFKEDYCKDLLDFSFLKKSTETVNFINPQNSSFQQDILLSKFTLNRLFLYAYEGLGQIKLNRPWNINTFNLTQNSYNKLGSITESTLFDYGLKASSVVGKEKFQLMIEDLERYFKVRSYLDTVMLESVILVSKNNGLLLKTKGGVPFHSFKKSGKTLRSEPINSQKRVLVNKPYSQFINTIRNLVEVSLEMPFYDEIAFNGNVDVSFDSIVLEFCTFELLQEALKDYGLELKIQLRPAAVVVVESIFTD